MRNTGGGASNTIVHLSPSSLWLQGFSMNDNINFQGTDGLGYEGDAFVYLCSIMLNIVLHLN